jgi:hypothetical protein
MLGGRACNGRRGQANSLALLKKNIFSLTLLKIFIHLTLAESEADSKLFLWG